MKTRGRFGLGRFAATGRWDTAGYCTPVIFERKAGLLKLEAEACASARGSTAQRATHFEETSS
jgi:hypothetical protein